MASHKRQKSKHSVSLATLKGKLDDAWVEYRNSMAQVNKSWDGLNVLVKDTFDSFDLNE